MDVLKRSTRALGIAVVAAAALAACSRMFDGDGAVATGPTFSHRIHVEEEGLDCSDCHLMVEDDDEPGMPALGGCMLCHGDLDEGKPFELTAAAIFEDGERRLATLADEVRFSHLLHVEAELDCAACHGDLTRSDAVGPEVAVAMNDCIACHDARGVPAADSELGMQGCAVCHTEIDETWAPSTHAHAWDRLHGAAASAELAGARNDCALCHTENACRTCHATTPPENHTNYWRRRGHTFTAAMDRESCATCHQSDFCDRCHQTTEPASHVGMFGGTKSTHCLGCHFPLSADEGCGVCHKSTPSHLLATPKPPSHTPGMNCLQCHGVGQPLPHVDKGDDCNQCHL